MSFGYDPELPAGFQEADLEMAELEREGNRRHRLRVQLDLARESLAGPLGANERAAVVERIRELTDRLGES